MRHNDHSHKMRDDEPQRHHKEAYVQPNEKKNIYIYISTTPKLSKQHKRQAMQRREGKFPLRTAAVAPHRSFAPIL